ncbi:siderophore-interacting protein [Dyella sp.]|uniref:siderophore-interacting protein n=1 Tax=Dyella sp. TaxID=1869338 RepID=UPI002D79127C|nr:siderophore-interacting protein [Dyella sp.]HET6432199.1 siderophore-interacting protein [Dyella sp.]
MTDHVHRTIRHPLVARTLEVLRVETLTPQMRRVVFGGESLRHFVTAAADDHVKLFFPNAAGAIVRPEMGPNGLERVPGVDYSPMRDYTPRHYDPQTHELTIDFVLHGDGPAARWAAQAAPGQQIGAGGPRGSTIIADDFDAYLLAGDESALPAIARRLDEMPAGTSAWVFVEIADRYERQPLTSRTEFALTWLERSGVAPAESTLLEDALAAWTPPPGDTFYWIAAESERARRMREALADQGVPKEHVKATGYWKAAATP